MLVGSAPLLAKSTRMGYFDYSGNLMMRIRGCALEQLRGTLQ
jgi:hypothetical protein